jgi:hypothetical protein
LAQQTLSEPTSERAAADPLTAALVRSRFGGDFSRVRINGSSMSESSRAPWAESQTTAGKGGTGKQARQLDIDFRVVRPAAAARSAALGQHDEEEVSASESGIARTAQLAPGLPGLGGPLAPGAGGCNYAISYQNIRRPGCGAGQCGAQIVYDVTGVTATGTGCPATLDGLRVTETVATDNGCGPGTVTTGAGCPIEEHPPMMPGHGVVRNCTDTYGLCGPAGAFPAAGCTETYTQSLSVGGVLAETRTIRFTISRTGGGCSGTVTRT